MWPLHKDCISHALKFYLFTLSIAFLKSTSEILGEWFYNSQSSNWSISPFEFNLDNFFIRLFFYPPFFFPNDGSFLLPQPSLWLCCLWHRLCHWTKAWLQSRLHHRPHSYRSSTHNRSRPPSSRRTRLYHQHWNRTATTFKDLYNPLITSHTFFKAYFSDSIIINFINIMRIISKRPK